MTDRAAREADEDAGEAEEADEGTEEAAQEENRGANGRIRAGEDAERGSFTRMNLRYGAGMGNTGSPSQRGARQGPLDGVRWLGGFPGLSIVFRRGRPAALKCARPLIDSHGARNVQS